MHSILKDGNYIQYGPKIIPNPNAEGSGGGGGGGSGDFSTATLTLDNQTDMSGQFHAPVIYDDGEYAFLDAQPTFEAETSATFEVVLYKNMCNIYIDRTYYVINVSGNITPHVLPGYYYITGDCTITLT